MELVERIKTPSGQEVNVIKGPITWKAFLTTNDHGFFSLFRGPSFILFDAEPGPRLRLLDRAALEVLERDGALDARELADALDKTKRYRFKLWGTNVRAEIVSAWFELADRRRLVAPFADDVPTANDARWTVTGRGREQIKRPSVLTLLPKAISPLSGILGIIVALLGGAAVVSQVIEENLDAIAGVALVAGVAVLYGLVLILLSKLISRWSIRVAVGSLELLWLADLLKLPGPRSPREPGEAQPGVGQPAAL